MSKWHIECLHCFTSGECDFQKDGNVEICVEEFISDYDYEVEN